jgi:hypothetical protein
MEWVWTWGGSSFGWIDDGQLYSHDGRHVAFIDSSGGEPLFSAVSDGRYLGEILASDRLITKLSRLDRYRRPRRERTARMAKMRRMNRMGKMMRMGYQDFPEPEEL